MKNFNIYYRISLSEGEDIEEKVDGICLEQSVELPLQVLSESLKDKVIGSVSGIDQTGEREFDVSISWPYDNIGAEITNFINILYGNISLQPGIRVTGADWELLGKELFTGPAFGIEGVREKINTSRRALSATALKPLGSDIGELAGYCQNFARGGMDIVKDDHGLANQEYAPFEPRVRSCVEAIRQAGNESGFRTLYFPNVTALASDALDRYELAAELGADGVLFCPHIAGLETMHQMARRPVDLPIIAHPAFSGDLTTHENQGLTPSFLYGQLWRALGADLVIYPNAGGRFSFTRQQCESINESARNDALPFKRSFPMPGGGIKRDNLPHWIETYGPDTVFLIGSSLYEHPEGLETASREFRSLLKRSA